jgi:hypothetical protein
MFTRWSYELPHAIDVFPDSGLRDRRPNLKGVALLPIKAATYGLIRLIQVLLLALDRYDGRRDFPLGWSLTATKAPS